MDNIKADAFLDITPDVCPITFVKIKLKLDQLNKGEVLEVLLNDGEPIQNVPRSVKGEGHKILSMEKAGEKYKLLIERGE
jgi:tRNA 2-thiouridine synthesizing protein A